MRCRAALPTLLLAAQMACYRDLQQLECRTQEPPAHCLATTAEALETGDTSSTSAGSDGTQPASSSSSSTGDSDSQDTDTSSTASGTTDTGGSTAVTPVCGDGVMDEGEECDDGLLENAGCNLFCKRDRAVFVASEPGLSAGMLQGLAGADNYCVSRAGLAKLPRALSFKAYLSDSQTDAVDRLYAGEGRYVLVDGTVVAEGWQAFVTQPLLHPIELNELGEVSHVVVWTGTRYGDGRAVPGLTHCDDWTSEDPDLTQGNWGASDSVDANWTQAEAFNPKTCGAMNAIYCIEQK